MYVASDIGVTTDGIQRVTYGIGAISEEALAAGVTPDPNTTSGCKEFILGVRGREETARNEPPLKRKERWCGIE